MLQPPRKNEPADAETNKRFVKRVLVVGWNGVEFPTLSPLLRSGHLPNLTALLDHGAIVNLSAPRPIFSQAAWTSLATGKRPHEHGILHSNTPSPDGSQLRPIACRARRSPAIWNILNRAGLRTNIVGWPVTHPAESLSGVCVSDRFAMPEAGKPQKSLDGRAISPRAAESVLRSLRVAPSQIEEMTLSQLLPLEAVRLAEYQTLAAICRGILAETATLFRALRWCLNERPWDFAACVFPGIRSCHDLANWMQGVSPAAAEFSKRLLAGCYEHHDLLLGQLLPLVGEDSHLIAISLARQGTESTEGNEDANAAPPMGTTIGTMGSAVICGPAVRHVTVPLPRNLLDLAPTICAMFAVPTGWDLFGRCWHDLFDVELQANVVEPREGNIGDAAIDEEHESSELGDSESDACRVRDQSVEHLVELGYVDPHDVAARAAVDNCRRCTELNRAISLMDAGLMADAVCCLEQLSVEHPYWLNARATLAEAYFRCHQWQSARQEIDWLMGRGNESRQLYLLAAAVALAQRQFDAALAELRCAARPGVVLPGSLALEGDIHLRKRNFAAAESAYRSSLERDGPTWQALDGLAAVNLHAGRFEEAAVNALDALAQEMRFSRAHYHLAVALLQLERPHEAVRALESWAALDPTAAAPFRWLARVYEQRLFDLPGAAASRAKGREVVRRRRKMIKPTPAVGTSTRSSAL